MSFLERVMEKELDSELAAKWIIQLVSAVHHLHSHGLMHRGIKEENIYITA